MQGINRGFTLIEVVVYLALFSILMSGLVLSLYGVEQSAHARSQASVVADESAFVEGKLAWDVSQTSSLSGLALDPATHALTLGGVPLTSSNVVVSSLLVSEVKDDQSKTIAYDVSFTMNNEPCSERYYLP